MTKVKKMTKRYLLTGSPGCGKTSLIIGLELKGYHVVREGAEDYIRYLKAQGRENATIRDEEQIQLVDLIVWRENQVSKSVEKVFLDRSFTDALVYSPSESLVQTISNLHSLNPFDCVFLVDYFPNYIKGNYRFEEAEEAHELHKKLKGVYVSLGYEPIIVPVMSLDKRIEFILGKIRKHSKD